MALLALAGPVPPSAARLPRIHEGLTARQVRALAALLACRGPVEAARRARVPRRTLFDWRRRNPAFRAAYDAALAALQAEALRAIVPAIVQAGEALAGCADGTRGVWPTIAGARSVLEAAGLLSPSSAAVEAVDALRGEVRRLAERVRALEEREAGAGGEGGERP
ncbi:MAG: hypothetical protein L6R43_05425 [Planctomycetes bacterium]|nr:hypothetical protein [Planctomycetota bacterium]